MIALAIMMIINIITTSLEVNHGFDHDTLIHVQMSELAIYARHLVFVYTSFGFHQLRETRTTNVVQTKN